MIWEQQCATIVMLSKEKEAGRPRCHKYWPESGALNFENLQVISRGENQFPDYILREITLVETKVSCS